MLHTDQPKQASEYLRQVIPMLSQQNLAPTPINYAVFYSYISGSSKALNEVVENTLSEKKSFDEPMMTELYNKYINGFSTTEQQDNIQRLLEKVMSEASDEIGQVNQGANEFDTTLNKHSTALSSINDPQAAALVMQQLMQDTRAMIKNNAQVQARMQETNEEIAKMKLELEAVKAIAEKDSLTGLKNRGTFDKAIEQLLNDDASSNATLIMLDIDHFKRINDNFGHLVGDRVIRYVSALLKQVIGKEHLVARYGGEEFAVIIKNKSVKEILPLAEKIRGSMANSKLQRKGSGETIGQVTLSVGLTSLKSDDDIEAFIERADRALYEAKETGRNKVISI
ncbi:MAG: GGDEF domain-containing protein [Cycloclasticus sp.]|nr:GGDEF domain-containing protein [Cycloclasticus sp.]MBQ0790428.1 GGDEF domain-containing protein [Cycloclasticus sp.]